MLLFAQPATRIVRLTIDDITAPPTGRSLSALLTDPWVA
jgi:hypothetical protein